MKIKELSKEQLWKLRQEVVLNSLFTNDFENSFGIDAKECQSFFDGYVEYLSELVEEDSEKFNVVVVQALDYDSPDNLYNWFCCIEWQKGNNND